MKSILINFIIDLYQLNIILILNIYNTIKKLCNIIK